MNQPRHTAMTAGYPEVTLPFGGGVSQVFKFWANAFDGAQFGLINIDLGATPDPERERQIISEVGSYGRQLGRLSEALEVLIDRLEAEGVLAPEKLTIEHCAALHDFRSLLSKIKAVDRA